MALDVPPVEIPAVALRVAGPHDVLEVAGRVGPEAVEGDVARAGEAARERGRARRPEKDLDVQQRGEPRGEGWGGEEEESVEDEEARGSGHALGGGGLVLDFFAEATGESEEVVVLLRALACTRIPPVFTNGRENALAGPSADRFAAVQPCVETGAQRGQIEGRGTIPVAMAGPERQGGFGPVEVVGVHEGDVPHGREDGEELGGDGRFAAGRDPAETEDEGGWRGRGGGEGWGSGHVVMVLRKDGGGVPGRVRAFKCGREQSSSEGTV